MGGNGRYKKWKIFLHRSSPASSPKPAPNEFICPISGFLMFDPVVVSSGQTFERASVEICSDLGFSPTLPDGSVPNFSTVISNLALRATILSWCKESHQRPPLPPDYSSIESAVQNLMAKSERRMVKQVADNPPLVAESHHCCSFSSSEESVIANSTTPSLLPFTTRPDCYSSPSSEPSNSSEIVFEDALPSTVSLSLPSSSGEDEAFVSRLTNLDVYEQEQAVISLRKITRVDEESRDSLCTTRLLLALKPLIRSRYAGVQTNAVASLLNLSLSKANKIKIVRTGVVPILIDLLKNGSEESQEHAAGAIFSLALEDENKMAIGALGALEPLLHSLRSGTESTRNDSVLALYHLSLVKSNRLKLIRLGGVGALLGMVRSEENMVGRVILVICNVAVDAEGRSALLNANAVAVLVERLRGGDRDLTESTRENCVAALYSLSQGSMRFKALAREARAEEVLRTVVERGGGERVREKARRILVAVRGRDEAEEGGEEVDWERMLEGGASRTRYRVGIGI